jgi:Transcriptional regulator
MTDIQINSFLTLAEELNFTKASRRLLISQSTLSTHISSLEKNLGVTLFIRTNKNVSLSPEGLLIYKSFRRGYDLMKQGIKAAKTLHAGHANKLRIGFIHGLQNDLMNSIMKLIHDFCTLYSITDLQVLSLSDNENVNLLKKNQLDLVFTFTNTACIFPDFSERVLLKNHLCLLYLADKYSETSPFSLDSLKKEELFILKKEVSHTEETFLRKFLELVGEDTVKVNRVNSMEAKLFYISAGYGIGFSDNMTWLPDPGKYGRFPIRDILIQYSFLYRKTSNNTVINKFLDFLDQNRLALSE